MKKRKGHTSIVSSTLPPERAQVKPTRLNMLQHIDCTSNVRDHSHVNACF